MAALSGKSKTLNNQVLQVLRGVFFSAVDNNLLLKSPVPNSLRVGGIPAKEKTALTPEQSQRLLDAVNGTRAYLFCLIALQTGMRRGEICGMMWSDIDFQNKRIRVDHQLQRKRDMEYIIEDTKTKSGERYVPMSQQVAECFHRVIANRKAPKQEPIIDGYTGFLFLDKNGMPMVALHWEHYFKHILNKYNSIYKVQLPKITPHVCRHTFCSNMARSGMSPKTLQYIMGHSDISVTLNTYTHLTFDDAKAEFDRVAEA